MATKTLISLIALITISYSVYSTFRLQGSDKTNSELYKELIGQKTKYEQLSKHAASLEIKYMSQEELQSKLNKNFSDEKIALKGRIKLLSNATYLIREKARKSDRADLVYQGKKIKYVFNELRFNSGPPIGYVMIFDDGRVVSKIYNHEIDVNLAVSREASGHYHVVSKANFVLKSGHLKHDGVNWFNKKYPLNIVGGSVDIDPVEVVTLPKRFIWRTQLNGNINIGNGIIPGLGVSLAGYGRSKNDLDWKFLQPGLQYKDSKLGVIVTPVLYRISDTWLPNTYIGPGINFDSKGNNYFLQFSIGL